MKKGIKIAVIISMLAVMALAAYNIYSIQKTYASAVEEYNEIQEEYVQMAPLLDTNKVTDFSDEFPALDIDFESLAERNPDFKGWLLMQSVGISYPVVQGEDNDFYLHNTFDLEANSSGCVYMDAGNKPDLSDYNTFIYGHNMKNGTMFGSLKQLNQEESGLLKENPFIYFYTPERVHKYRVYSYHVNPPESEVYSYVKTEGEYRKYLDLVTEMSAADLGVEVSTDAKTLTLSTCSGTGAGKRRFVVHGIEVGDYPTYRLK